MRSGRITTTDSAGCSRRWRSVTSEPTIFSVRRSHSLRGVTVLVPRHSLRASVRSTKESWRGATGAWSKREVNDGLLHGGLLPQPPAIADDEGRPWFLLVPRWHREERPRVRPRSWSDLVEGGRRDHPGRRRAWARAAGNQRGWQGNPQAPRPFRGRRGRRNRSSRRRAARAARPSCCDDGRDAQTATDAGDKPEGSAARAATC